MANSKHNLIALMAMALILMGAQIAWSVCPTTITIGNVTVDPCVPTRVNIPVFMNNPCAVGGFEFRIITTQRSWLHFTPGDANCADSIGSRISDWEMFSANVHAANDSQIIVTGIADMPGGRENVLLPPGDGLLFTMHIDYSDHNVCDSSQMFDFTRANVSDPTGYILYDTTLVRDYFYVLPGRCNGNPRGDANCSGGLNGLDVTYLVAYLKGLGPAYCCLCSGDANSSGGVNGIDVTYLVGYFKGGQPAPAPCD